MWHVGMMNQIGNKVGGTDVVTMGNWEGQPNTKFTKNKEKFMSS